MSSEAYLTLPCSEPSPPCTWHPQSSLSASKAPHSVRSRWLLAIFFLVICCNYEYIHSGDMPLICACEWANGFKVCLFLCVCMCCQHASLKWILICRQGACPAWCIRGCCCCRGSAGGYHWCGRAGWSAILSGNPSMKGILQSWSLCKLSESSGKWAPSSSLHASMKPTDSIVGC